MTRERTLLVAGVALLSCAVIAAFILFTRDDGDEVRAGEIVLATAINPDTSAPVDEVESFSSTSEEIFATLPVDDVDEGTTFRFRWTKGGTDEVTDEHRAPSEIDDGWVFGSLSRRGGFEPGDDYAVEVLIGDDSIAIQTFSVTE